MAASGTADLSRLSTALEAFKQDCELMARLADVGSELHQWAASGDEMAGGNAADALDQLCGHLEQLPTLLTLIRANLAHLPPTIFD